MVLDIGNKLVQAITKQTGRVIYFSQVENISPNIAVHEVRKSFKRIRALLRFCLNHETAYFHLVAQQLSEFGKALSSYRNSWVNLQILEKISKESPYIPDYKLKYVKERLNERNKELLQNDITEQGIGAEIREHQQKFEINLQKKISAPDDLFITTQLVDSFQKGFDIYQEENILNSWERLHKLRKKLKVLYYQCNFLIFHNAKYFKFKSDQLNIVTEQLGDIQDLCVFLDEIKKGEYNLDPTEIVILENKVNHLRELDLLKCQPRLKQFFTETPSSFSEKISPLFEI